MWICQRLPNRDGWLSLTPWPLAGSAAKIQPELRLEQKVKKVLDRRTAIGTL
jgi:hypothetical protein